MSEQPKRCGCGHTISEHMLPTEGKPSPCTKRGCDCQDFDGVRHTDPAPKQLSAFLTIMLDQAIQLAKDDEAAERGVPSTLEQRICIGLVQARALELRTVAGTILLKGLGANPMALKLSMAMRERSHKLEQLGLALAKHWPPTPDDFPMEPWVELM